MRRALVFVLLPALLLAGCKALGPTGNPDDLTGTWNALVSAFAATYPVKVTQITASGVTTDYEGTWNLTVVTPPAISTVYTDPATGITLTTHNAGETSTTTTTYNLVVTADGSSVLTVTQATVQVARAAIAAVGTGTSQTGGAAAILDASVTVTTTYTYTVTDTSGSGMFQEVRNYVQSALASGAYIGANASLRVPGAGAVTVTLSAAAQSMSDNSTNTTTSKTLLGYFAASTTGVQVWNIFTAAFGTTPALTHTVQGTTPTAAYQNKVDTTWALVVAKEGTYTLTKTVTATQVDRAAIAGTATVAASPAVVAGTTVQTTVYTGTLTSSMFSDAKYLDFIVTTAAVASIGTGGLISPDYPATALATNGATSPLVWEYSITAGSGSGASTWMTVRYDMLAPTGTLLLDPTPVYVVFQKAAT